MTRRRVWGIMVSGFMLTAVAVPVSAQEAGEAAGARFFETKIRPVLAERCYKCHSHRTDSPKSDFTLDSRAGLLHGGARGPAIVAGQPDKSRLIQAIRYTNPKLRMPPDKKLPDAVIADFEKWIGLGAPWPKIGAPSQSVPDANGKPFTDDERSYWAYQPIQRPPVPQVKSESWVTNPIDAFILAKLEDAGLQPSPPATKRQLIRRAYFDLIGLPPTPQQVRDFLADESPQAWERLIDDLLSRPQYGEKWGRHWLDVVRYAQTNGYERDGTKPNAWRYRDYVIRSFNEDKPFDRFIIEQLAGDELPASSPDAIIATGFYRLGLWQDEPVDFEQNYYEQLDDIVRTTSEAFLGTTLGCARCHEHKADPIPQADYYRFLAFFHGIEPYSKTRETASPFNQTEISSPDVRKRLEVLQDELGRATAELRQIEDAGIAKFPDADRIAATGDQRQKLIDEKLHQYLTDAQRQQYSELKQRRDALQREKSALPREFALSVNHCLVNPPPTHVLLRGNAAAKAREVQPGFPQVLGFPDPDIPTPAEDADTSRRRLVLARWIASKQNPLTGRVIANRLWQHHFGRGIVPTPNDFGGLGTPPTHPKLLDWLAAELMANGWRLKAMHKLIMTSSAYRMSSNPSAQPLALGERAPGVSGSEKDPANDLFWRFNVRRLTAEEIRDAILSVNGTLNLKMGGRSIYTKVPDAVLQTWSRPDQAWGTSPPSEQVRRSVYIFIKRSLIEPVLGTFDYPDTDASTAFRFVTTVPTQTLTSLNGGFFNREAKQLAERLRREAGDGDEPPPRRTAEQVRLAFWLALSRPPEPHELQRCLDLMHAWQTDDGLSREQALESFCLLVYNLNEFVYVD